MRRSSRRRQSNTSGRKLKKQPKLKRMNAVAPVARPRLTMPKSTAQAAQRRRRSTRRRVKISFPTQLLKRVVTSARWLSLGLLAVVVYAFITIGSYEAFYLTRIPVEGVFSISAEEIVAASGLAGEHIFAADPEKASTAITAVPGIIGATVEISWPNEVMITIQEDAPIAIWADPDGTFWVNEQGKLIPARLDVPSLYTIRANSTGAVIGRQYVSEEDVAAAEAEISPVASEVDGEEEVEELVELAEVGSIAELGKVPAEILDAALLLSRLLPERNSIIYDTRHGLTFTDSRGWDVYLGTGTDIEQKLVVYESIVTELQAQSLVPEYVSVSNQDKPFYFAYEQIDGN